MPKFTKHQPVEMGVSLNSGTPKSSILIGLSITNYPFWGTPIFGNPQIVENDRSIALLHSERIILEGFPSFHGTMIGGRKGNGFTSFNHFYSIEFDAKSYLAPSISH